MQSVLAEAIQPILSGAPLTIHAAGRTDTGVHALGQVISFSTESRLPVERWAIAINTRLPRDVAVANVEEAPPGFHARFSARSRTYRYLIWTRRTRSAIWDRYSLHARQPLDVAVMREAGQSLIGSHDFTAYKRSGGNPGTTTVRHLQRLSVRRLPSGLILVTVTANAFLRSMVRNIVGVLIEIGKGDLASAAALEILATRDRNQNPCAPAAPHGLCLWRVDY